MTTPELPRRWGIYLVDLAQRVGSRPGKVRPCLAIQPGELAAIGLTSTIVLPLTTRLAVTDAFPLRIRIPAGTAGLRATSEVMVDQIIACGNAYFRERIGILPVALRGDVRDALRDLLEL
jgi:mRNA interferase MazF